MTLPTDGEGLLQLYGKLASECWGDPVDRCMERKAARMQMYYGEYWKLRNDALRHLRIDVQAYLWEKRKFDAVEKPS